MATALVHEGGRRVVRDDESLIIGRGRDCDVVTDDPSVSRRHAKLKWGFGRGTIFDLDSPNGVFVNGKRIVRKAVVGSGDAIRLGDYGLKLSLADSAIPDPEIVDEDTYDGEEDDVTVVANSASLSIAIALRLLEKGELEAAEHSLRNCWDGLRSRAHAVHPAVSVLGARAGLKIAAATRKAEWADDSAMILASVDQPPDLETLGDLARAAACLGLSTTLRAYLSGYGDESGMTEAEYTALTALLAQ